MTTTTTKITGTVDVDDDNKGLTFTAWLYLTLSEQIKINPNEDERVFCGNYRKGDSNFYLWSSAEETAVRERLENAFSLDYFTHSHHLHLYTAEQGGNVGIVFTHKVEVRGSDLGDQNTRRESQKEAKSLSAVKHHPGGNSDVNSDCLLVSQLTTAEIGQVWNTAPQWQLDLVGVLRKFTGNRLRELSGQKKKVYGSWYDQWKEIAPR